MLISLSLCKECPISAPVSSPKEEPADIFLPHARISQQCTYSVAPSGTPLFMYEHILDVCLNVWVAFSKRNFNRTAVNSWQFSTSENLSMHTGLLDYRPYSRTRDVRSITQGSVSQFSFFFFLPFHFTPSATFNFTLWLISFNYLFQF